MESEERILSHRRRHIPVIDERQITIFDSCLQCLGAWNPIGRSFTNDGVPGIVCLHWIIPGEQWRSEEGIFQFLDQRLHRRVLHWLLHPTSLNADTRFSFHFGWSKWNEVECVTWDIEQLAMAVGRDREALFPILRFLTLQGISSNKAREYGLVDLA